MEKLKGFKGTYEIKKEVARGGFGLVREAVDQDGKRVAVKTLLEKNKSDTEKRDCLILEGIIQQNLDSKYIIPTYDTAIDEKTGTAFVVMELMNHNLKHYLKSNGITLNDTLALRLIRSTAAALEYVHSQGIVMCDFKPENVLFDSNGNLKLADFGIAYIELKSPFNKVIAEEMVKRGLEYEPEEDLSNSHGQTMGSTTRAARARGGTEQYTALEVLRRGIGTIDQRADVYSLARVSREMLWEHLKISAYKEICAISTNAQWDERHDSVKDFMSKINSVVNYHGEVLAHLKEPLSLHAIKQLDATLEKAAVKSTGYTGPWQRIYDTLKEEVIAGWVEEALTSRSSSYSLSDERISQLNPTQNLELSGKLDDDAMIISQLEQIQKKYEKI